MICKWCGEAVDPGSRICGRCGRELPPMTDCGGFYQVMPSARPAQVQPPVQQQTRIPPGVQNRGINGDQHRERNPGSTGVRSTPPAKKNTVPILVLVFMALSVIALLFSILSFALTSARLKKIEDRLSESPSVAEAEAAERTEPTNPLAETESDKDVETATETVREEPKSTETPAEPDPSALADIFKEKNVVLRWDSKDNQAILTEEQTVKFSVAVVDEQGSDRALQGDEVVLEGISGKWKCVDSTAASGLSEDMKNDLKARFATKPVQLLCLELSTGGEDDVFAYMYFCAAPSNGQNLFMAIFSVKDGQTVLPVDVNNNYEYTWETLKMDENGTETATGSKIGNRVGSFTGYPTTDKPNCRAIAINSSDQFVTVHCTRRPRSAKGSLTVQIEKLPLEMLLQLNENGQ